MGDTNEQSNANTQDMPRIVRMAQHLLQGGERRPIAGAKAIGWADPAELQEARNGRPLSGQEFRFQEWPLGCSVVVVNWKRLPHSARRHASWRAPFGFPRPPSRAW